MKTEIYTFKEYFSKNKPIEDKPTSHMLYSVEPLPLIIGVANLVPVIKDLTFWLCCVGCIIELIKLMMDENIEPKESAIKSLNIVKRYGLAILFVYGIPHIIRFGLMPIIK